MFLLDIFQTFIYQPLFNILILFYWGLDQVMPGGADMGIAVIFLTILVRILLLPISIAGDQSVNERREISQKLALLKETYRDDPIGYRQMSKKVFRSNRRVIISELISLSIQVIIALSLWKIFAKGLMGSDLHLIYDWMPKVDFPFNLMFLGKYSLNEPHWQLNIIQSGLIFILETLSVLTSPFPTSRAEVIRMQLTLPIISYLIFSQLPAGKKLFVIVTLIFSIVLTIVKFLWRQYKAYKEKETLLESKEQAKTVI